MTQAQRLYKVSFLNHGALYTLYARQVASSTLWGYTEIADLVFDVHEGVVVDPTEERLRAEFGDTRRLHLPMQAVVRIEEVDRKGPAAIREAGEAATVMPFPLPPRAR